MRICKQGNYFLILRGESPAEAWFYGIERMRRDAPQVGGKQWNKKRLLSVKVLILKKLDGF